MDYWNSISWESNTCITATSAIYTYMVGKAQQKKRVSGTRRWARSCWRGRKEFDLLTSITTLRNSGRSNIRLLHTFTFPVFDIVLYIKNALWNLIVVRSTVMFYKLDRLIETHCCEAAPFNEFCLSMNSLVVFCGLLWTVIAFFKLFLKFGQF